MLQIYNSLTRRKAPFQPIEPGRVRMYVCGMTVYDYCHLGHARVLVVFDVVYRYLRALGYTVTYVRNITDIDDKIIRRANENGETIQSLTERFIQAMHEDAAALGVLPPTEEPRATEHIGEILSMVQTLIDKGFAYVADNGDVYYAVSRFPDYGKLSGKSPSELRAGARVEIGEAKRDPLDFVLWKAAKPGEPAWDSPWGPGRPGWHIECSAMSTCALGNHFDIHGGGADLQFRTTKTRSPTLKAPRASPSSMSGCTMALYVSTKKRRPNSWAISSRCERSCAAIGPQRCVISSSPATIAARSITTRAHSSRRVRP
jgi:cysteinyl-tRNA synthetase (EC 6.1.1.16)